MDYGRQKAIANGDKTYQADKPCGTCGEYLKRTSTYQCIACARKNGRKNAAKYKKPYDPTRNKRWYEQNKADRQQYAREYRKSRLLDDCVIYYLAMVETPTTPLYVGQTKEPNRRRWSHKSLRPGVDFVMKTITRVPDEDKDRMEQHFIKHFMDMGYELENVQLTKGGD